MRRSSVRSRRCPHQTRYFPYGQVYWKSGASQTDFGFTGQRVDGFGLMDYNARYYDSLLGRFVQADTIVSQPGNTLTWDRYAYGVNNPLKYVDPTGHYTCEDSMPYCDLRKLSYDWELPNSKLIPNFENRPKEIISATRTNYNLIRYQLYFTYGEKAVNSNGKIEDQHFIAALISREFGGYEDHFVYNEALEALSNQYYDTSGDNNQMFCNHNCTTTAQIAWASDAEAFYRHRALDLIYDNPYALDEYLGDAYKVMNGYLQGVNNSWMWGNVTVDELKQINGQNYYNGHIVTAIGNSFYPSTDYFIVWGN